PSGGATVAISGTTSTRLGSVTFGSNTINIAKLYDVKVSLTDAYSTVTVSNIVPTVSRVFDFRNDRAALGGIAAIADSFQVPLGWKMYADGNKEVFHDGRTVPIANGGTGATTAATARTNLGITLTNLGVTATATELNYVDGVTSAIQTQLNGKAASSHGTHVPTPQTANNAIYLRNDNTWQTITAAEIGAAASSHSHSYLPLAGGTLTGAVNVQSTGASWLSGKTYGAVNALKQSSGSYHPVIRIESYAGNVFNLGGLGESVGFYGFYKDRTVNGTDWNFVVNTGTGNWSTNGSITASSFSGSLAWSNLTGVPSSFTPSTHTHSYLSLSGGTLSGSITLPGSVVLA
ncbi:MAG: hypothetical protein PHG93_04615, partial [Candidatus Methanomethylophilaceae archaeon]|nr:hypothetical protein [Candidatus Methanomethylophilaceae archaeon]